ncbi:MAG: hypothetical protein ABII90_15890 [Bacteroidota bacterium]
MEALIVKIDTAANAKILAAFLKTINSVKSVVFSNKTPLASVVKEPEGEYNWVNPSRPATDKEFEQMISEAEAGKSYTSDQIMARFKLWKKQQYL